MTRKYKKAQQLLEFALIVPFVVIILMLLMETALALYSRVVFTDAVKMSLMQINEDSKYGGNDAQKEESIKGDLRKKIFNYMDSQNMAFSVGSGQYSSNINIDIKHVSGSDNSLVSANYIYQPSFLWNYTLPNGQKLVVFPTGDLFSFYTTQLVNNVLLKGNTFNTFTTQSGSVSSFADSNSETSILKKSTIDYHSSQPVSIEGRRALCFLVGTDSGSDNYARLYNWYGLDLLPTYLMININSGRLRVKSPYIGGYWTDTQVPYTWVLAAMGISQAIYTKKNSLTYPNIQTQNIENSSYLNNYALGLDSIASKGTAIGSFDPLKTNTYNKVYNYSISLSNYYLLKLSIPNSNLPANLQSAFSPIISGAYTQKDITDAYLDNDGDGIPNAWDLHPGYFDANANGVLDGLETASITLDASLPDMLALETAVSASLGDANLRSPLDVYTPTVVNYKEEYSYIPVKSTAKFDIVSYTDPSTGKTALYYKNEYGITRKTPDWSATRAVELDQKTSFTNATISGNNLRLKTSYELDLLLKGPFQDSLKVSAN